MMGWIVLSVAVLVAAAAALLTLKLRRRERTLKRDHFQTKWRDLQKQLSDKKHWPHVVKDADKLLDEALRKKRVGGKTMGERLVHAQRLFSDNDAVWFGHKLRGKLDDDPRTKLKEADVKDALVGIRQGLKDLGALPDGKQRNPR